MNSGYRCYAMMDSRDRWRSWIFAPATAAQHARLVEEAAAAEQVLFVSAQSFTPPHSMAGRMRWNMVKQQYSGENALPHSAPLYFDIDCEDELDKALLWARSLVEFFADVLELPEPAVRVWFSGSKGVHLMVDEMALGIQASATLTADMKAVAMALVKHLTSLDVPDLSIDSAVYSLPRMIRLPDQVNPRSGLHKVELYHRELLRLSADQIMELARTHRGALWSAEDLPRAPVLPAAEWWAKALARAKAPRDFRIKTALVAGLKVRPDGYLIDELADVSIPSCINGMMHTAVSPGSRNRCELQIACWAKAVKMPFNKGLSLLVAWTARNRPELSADNAQRKAESILRSVYGNATYGFSCAAARSAACAAGVATGCGECRVIRRHLPRQVSSLRIRHDEQWNPSPRIPLEESRGIVARAIYNRVAGADRSGHGASGHGQDPRHATCPGQQQDAGHLCYSDS